jgi:RecB family endonuclease NucS
MTTRIKTWQILDGKLHVIESSMAQEGRTEPYDLEEWIASDPSIVGPDLIIVGRQVATISGPLDLLAVDRDGNLVVIELKRGMLPREALAQAMDYASDLADWDLEKINAICLQ